MSFSVRQARLLAGKTQQEMADAIGVCRQTYMNYENNPDAVPICHAKVIAKVTGQSVDSIFFSSDSTYSRVNNSF